MRLFLNKNQVAICDAVDFEAVSAITWTAKKLRGKYVTVHSYTAGEEGRYLYLHRFIMERMGFNVAGKVVRPRDGDFMNCSRMNLACVGDNLTNCPENQAELAAYKSSLSK